jgi:drug/metabolite transporter (DMT)-like permease
MQRPNADTNLRFGAAEWIIAAAMALTWGASFLLIDVIIRDAPTLFVPFGRACFGAVALWCMPASRARMARAHRPRLVLLGMVWMALPFWLFPLAERTVASSIAGMMNGALPVVVTAVTAVWLRQRPSLARIVAVLVGFAGIVLVALPSVRDGSSADAAGIGMLVGAILCYAVGLTIARPLLDAYPPIVVLARVLTIAALWSAPTGLAAAADVRWTWRMLASLATLGALGSGLAFVLFGSLLRRTGPVRAMVPTYFTPVVGTVLGVAFNDEHIRALSLAGMGVVILGAWLTSRPDGR